MVTGLPSKLAPRSSGAALPTAGSLAASVSAGSGAPVTWTGRLWARLASAPPPPPLRHGPRAARTLVRANGPDSAVAAAIGSDRKGYASLALYAAGVGLAFVSPWIAYGCYVAVAVLWFIPDRRFTRL